MSIEDISELLLDQLEKASLAADPPPWTAIVEGRDQLGGASFILVGTREDGYETDVYVTRDTVPAAQAELDVIALSRTYLPVLVAEIRRLRSLLDE